MAAATIRHEQGLRPQLAGLLSLAAASCLAVTTEMLPVGLLPAMGRDLGVDESTIGLLVTLYAIMVAALAVPVTFATARFPRKPLLAVTVACYAVSNAMVALAPDVALVAAGRTVGGVTHALFFSLCIGYVPRLVASAHVGRALSIATGGASAGFVLGVPLSTSLGNAVGWRSAFAVLAGLALVALLFVVLVLPAIPNDRAAEGSTGRKADLAAVVASNALTYLGQFTVYTFIALLFLEAGLSEGWIGPLLLVCGACGLVGLVYAARTLDRRPRRTAIVVLGIVIGAVLVMATAYPALGVVVALAAIWNGAFGGVPSVYQASAVRTRAVAPELAGAWVNSSANFGIAGGAAIGAGLLPVIGVGGLPWVAAALMSAGLAVVVLARRSFPAEP